MRNYRPQIIPPRGPISLYLGRRLADNRDMETQRTPNGMEAEMIEIKIERDETMPLIEQVREATEDLTQEGEPRDFVPVGLALGLNRKTAQAVHNSLSERIDRANGWM